MERQRQAEAAASALRNELAASHSSEERLQRLAATLQDQTRRAERAASAAEVEMQRVRSYVFDNGFASTSPPPDALALYHGAGGSHVPPRYGQDHSSHPPRPHSSAGAHGRWDDWGEWGDGGRGGEAQPRRPGSSIGFFPEGDQSARQRVEFAGPGRRNTAPAAHARAPPSGGAPSRADDGSGTLMLVELDRSAGPLSLDLSADSTEPSAAAGAPRKAVVLGSSLSQLLDERAEPASSAGTLAASSPEAAAAAVPQPRRPVAVMALSLADLQPGQQPGPPLNGGRAEAAGGPTPRQPGGSGASPDPAPAAVGGTPRARGAAPGPAGVGGRSAEGKKNAKSSGKKK